MRKASDYEIGDELYDANHSYGRVISVMEHPGKRQLTYMLLYNSESGFTIFSCTSDAVCNPWVARMVPKEVMKRFLFDAFIGVDLPDVPETGGKRYPITTVPTYAAHKAKPKVIPEPVKTVQRKSLLESDEVLPPPEDAEPAPPAAVQDAPVEPPQTDALLPVFDWP